MDFINTKHKGDTAVTQGIACLTEIGYQVCVPIGDRQPYDLVVDGPSGLQKVQVKYAGMSARGRAVAQLRVVGGNKTFTTAKFYSKEDFDLLFVWTYNGNAYLFPWSELTVKNELAVDTIANSKYKIN